MKKLSNFFKRYKKIILLASLIVLLIAIAVFTFGDSSNKINVNSSSRSDTEQRLINILSEIEGVGRAEVMITEGENGVIGVVIVCEGANNIMTKNNVINATTVALKINKNNIAVYAMN